MLEPKARREIEDEEVIAKRDVAVQWCRHASDYAETNGGKPWCYLLIPHDSISENMTLTGFADKFVVES